MLRVAIDVMGADKGVQPIVLGALDAIKKREFEAILVGDESQISPLISPLSNELKSRVKIKHCADYIRMEESATEALKRNESSIFVATELVKNGETRLYRPDIAGRL